MGGFFGFIHQGVSAERIAETYGLSREELDAYSLESHRRAIPSLTVEIISGFTYSTLQAKALLD
jgi:hypothetical protein